MGHIDVLIEYLMRFVKKVHILHTQSFVEWRIVN